jgi:formate dehydrogenase subunit delta
MSSSTEHLVEMANDIGNYFRAEPDQVAARAGILQHIQRFWEPRMRRKMAAYLADTGGEGLEPLVREALAELKA